MRASRVVALATVGPLAVALAWLAAHEPIDRWLAFEPVVVVEGSLGTPHTVGGPVFTVIGAAPAPAGSDAAEYADAPDGAQVVLVDVDVDGADDVLQRCAYVLEATVDGVHGRWGLDGGASDVADCYDETGSLSGGIAFVLPGGEISDARLLIGGSYPWIGVPLPL